MAASIFLHIVAALLIFSCPQAVSSEGSLMAASIFLHIVAALLIFCAGVVFGAVWATAGAQGGDV